MEDFDFDVNAAFVYDLPEKIENKYICVKNPPASPKRGDEEYYVWRFNNFMERHVDCSHEPPVYYYGPLETQQQINYFIKTIDNKDYSVPPFSASYIPNHIIKWIIEYLPEIWKNISNTREQWLGLEQELVKRLKNIPPTHRGTIPNITKSYGYKYCVAFGTLLSPKLSPLGQSWVRETLIFLQNYMEDGLVNKNWIAKNNGGFNSKYGLRNPTRRKKFYENVELSTVHFRDFAFATHPDAYLKAGLAYLPIEDLIKIMFTPDFTEWKELDTIEQAAIVFVRYIQILIQRLIKKGAKIAREVINDIINYFDNLF